MSRTLPEEVLTSVKELITVISGFEEGTEIFNNVLKYFVSKLKKSDTMYFLNKRDVDQNIEGMCEKFCFHGFFPQSQALKAAYKIYIPETLKKSDIMTRLNVVKFLLCMSERPTKNFLENPEMFVPLRVEEEEQVNWAKYLNEGIEQWRPNLDVSSEEEFLDNPDQNDGIEVSEGKLSDDLLPKQIQSRDKIVVMDFQTIREELLNTVQHSWFHEEKFVMKPESGWREANIGILWQKHLSECSKGLISLTPPNFITEYKVIREILWQLWYPHKGAVFEIRGNNVMAKKGVTLASVRQDAFYEYINHFVQYIDLLEFFREFNKLVLYDCDVLDPRVSCTYRSYCNSINKIIHPVYKRLSELQEEVRKEETTYTLLTLINDLDKIMNPIKVLRQIHSEVIVDFRTHAPLTCATNLLANLHESLHLTADKLEQDLKVTLFLDTLYYYFGRVESWLIKDDLSDYAEEFVIERIISADDCNIHFKIRDDIDERCRNNSFLKIFTEKVLKIGRNINFLRQLGKYDVIGDSTETVYDEFVSKIFKKLNKFYDIPDDEPPNADPTSNSEPSLSRENFIFPILGLTSSKTNPGAEKLENLVDTEDGFLMSAFRDFFVKKELKNEVRRSGIFERLSATTKNLFPKTDFFESVFSEILDDRFTISGLMVKNLLIEEHLLEKQFQFLRHLYLFFDDMIFPFYRRLFERTESSNKIWANDIWLTSHLHDIFMDVYPEFYERCSVQIKDGWSVCADSLAACKLINVSYDIRWPLNIIIKERQLYMYRDVYQFLIGLKWALHTLNHLMFLDLEPSHQSSTKKAQKTFKFNSHKHRSTPKLIRLKFSLINILNSLQHFVFGFVFGKKLMKFELDFEKAFDLNSLIESHEDFIVSLWSTIDGLNGLMMGKEGDNNVLSCVKLLKMMWNDLTLATPDRLSECNKIYESFYRDISPVIFPVYIYDF